MPLAASPGLDPFQPLREFIAEALRQRQDEPADSVKAPSAYWLDYNRFSRYIRTLPPEELGSIRYHTWHFTGENYFPYHTPNRKDQARILGHYGAICAGLGGVYPHEPATGLGYETPHGKVSASVVRYAVVLRDIVARGLLDRTTSKTVLEIGGGYGGLAAIFLQYNPTLAYLLCDLEETLFVQGVNLANQFGHERIHPVRTAEDIRGLQAGHVYLVPQVRSELLRSAACHLVLNQQSMQEMTAAQVDHYVGIIRHLDCPFYSCNKNQHSRHIAGPKGLVTDLHALLAAQFRILWDSHQDLSPLLRIYLRNRILRRLLSKLTRKAFEPVGEESFRRFLYGTK
jgi:hypothetical protein